MLQPALKEVGLDGQGVAFHAFRKACGSLLLAKGGKDLKQIQGWLRHSQMTTTMNTYIHEVDGGLGSADVLDEILGGGKKGQHDTHREPQTDTIGGGVDPAPDPASDEPSQTAAESRADS